MTHLLSRRRALLPALVAGAALAALAIGLQSAPARSSGTTTDSAVAGTCHKGSVAARIGGKRRCLRAGQRCKKRFERQYRRHGFHCQAGRLRKVRKHPPPPPPPPPPPDPPPPPLNGTGGLHSTAGLALQGAPIGAALGFGSFWVRVGSGYNLFRIDTATAQVTARIEGLATAPFAFSQDVAAGEGAIWTSNINSGSVTRIDPATNRVVTTIPVWPTNVCGPEPSTSCSSPMAIAFTPGAVWVILHHEWAVVRIDPATNTVVATISLGSGPPRSGLQELTVANGFVYAGGSSGFGGPASLERIDPATNIATPVVDVANGCDAKAGTGTHVWLVAGATGCGPNLPASLLDIDTLSGTVVGSVALDNSPYALAAGWGSVWALTDKLTRVDPASHTVTGTVPLPDGQSYVAADDHQLWLAVPGGVYQIGQ